MVSSGENHGVEWTVSRCFRLLRPIVSRKSTLRSERPTGAKRDEARARIAPSATRHRFGESPNPKLDPDWMSKKPQRIAARQYSRLTSDTSSDPDSERLAGTFSIPTPVVTRIRGIGSTDNPSPLHQKLDGPNGRDIFTEKFISQTDELNFRSQKLVQGTLDLIEATNVCSTQDAQKDFFPANGPKSLRAMCCRRYARHIVELEDEQDTEDADTKFDVATEAYALLDETFDLGASDYLRAIAREHGIVLFEKMVLNSQIPRAHVLALIRRMRNPQRSRVKHSSSAEVESISSVLLRLNTPDKPCCSRDNTYAYSFNTLAELSGQCDRLDKQAFEFRQLESMVTSTLPVCWFGSRRMTSLWTNLFRAFMDAGRRPQERLSLVRDASNFLEAVILLDCGLKQTSTAAKRIMASSAVPDYYGSAMGCPKCPKMPMNANFIGAPSHQQPHGLTSSHASRKRLSSALSNSFSSIFAIFASFAISSMLHPEKLPFANPDPVRRLLGSLSVDILLALTVIDKSNDDSALERCNAVLATTLLVSILEHSDNHDDQLPVLVGDLIEGLEAIDQRARRSVECSRSTLEILPDLVVSVIQSSTKLLGKDGFEILSLVTAALTSSSRWENNPFRQRLFLNELAISSTQVFAERSESEDSSRLATALGKDLCGQRSYSVGETPFKTTPRLGRDREGLRWEDSIGEWIETMPRRAGPNNKAVDRQVSNRFPAMLQANRQPIARGTLRYSTDTSCDWHEKLFSEDSVLLHDEETSHSVDKEDVGLSSLLLSPDIVVSSSPIQQHEPVIRPQNREKRKPLAEKTNLEIVSAPIHGNQMCTIKGRDHASAKRTWADSNNHESDDELSVPRPKKRSHVVAKPRPEETRDFGRRDVDELDSASEDSFSSSSTIQHKDWAPARRNPRGKLLRSVYPQTRHSQSYASSILGDTDDEL